MIRRLLPVVGLLLLACAGLGEKEPQETGRRDEADADADTDADTDADADADSDADTDTEPDLDDDGWSDFDDCNDTDPAVNPGAKEVCNGIDDDCDEAVDENGGTVYRDYDGDGYGDDDVTETGCDAGEGWVTVGGDCDDRDAQVHPGAEEVCANGDDDDCDGAVDDADTSADCGGYTSMRGLWEVPDFGCMFRTTGAPGGEADCPSCDFSFETVSDDTTGNCITDLELVMGYDASARDWLVYWYGERLGAFDAVLTSGGSSDEITWDGTSDLGYYYFGAFTLYE